MIKYITILLILFPPPLKNSIIRLHKKNNGTSNPWYDKDCKIDKKEIRYIPNERIKFQNISIYKSLIKRKKRSYINKREDHIFHLSKVAPIKF